jgi:TPR repeat protein
MPQSAQDVANLAPSEWQAIIAGEPHTAAQWMLHAARLDNANAQAVLGQWLLDGHGLERNPQDAHAWFLKEAKQGHAMGMNMAGRCFENGWGTEVNLFAALNWYAQAAGQGLDAGMYNYANMLAAGQTIAQDHAGALYWYRKSANVGYAKSMTKIGRYYEDGLVVAQDADVAFFAYGEGARGGDFRGQFNFAGMLAARGHMDEALMWLRKVPFTATPGYRQLAGHELLLSAHPAFREVGQQMLDSLVPCASELK